MDRERSTGRQRRAGILAVALFFACMMISGAAGAQLLTAPKQVQAAANQAALPGAADRQKAQQADAARLLQMATQLKANVDRSRKDELSLQVIREADEIEKLARAARSRIR